MHLFVLVYNKAEAVTFFLQIAQLDFLIVAFKTLFVKVVNAERLEVRHDDIPSLFRQRQFLRILLSLLERRKLLTVTRLFLVQIYPKTFLLDKHSRLGYICIYVSGVSFVLHRFFKLDVLVSVLHAEYLM